jgi:predicted Rossmann fold flavoprotein
MPDTTERQLDEQLQRDFDQHGKRTYKSILAELLQPKMIEPFLEMTGISPGKLAHQITAEERKCLVKLLKSLRFNIKWTLPLASAMVTAGGVSLKEINPRTMESLLVKGLYFCGEVIDIDAETGGYNLQAAFSTGYVAGEQAAKAMR